MSHSVRHASGDHSATLSPTLSQRIETLSSAYLELDLLLTSLDIAAWRMPTRHEGWTVLHNIAYLARLDRSTMNMLNSSFNREPWFGCYLASPSSRNSAIDVLAERPADLLKRWRRGRRRLIAIFRAEDARTAPGSSEWAWLIGVVDARQREVKDHRDAVTEAIAGNVTVLT